MSCRSLVLFAIGLNEGTSAIDESPGGIDHVLAQICERTTSVFRQSDLIVRWGVDEILAVATQADADQACAMAERLCEAIGNRPFLSSDGGSVKHAWSVGVSTLPFLPEEPDVVGWEMATQLAEAALHEATQTGSCRWCVIAGGAALAWST